MNDIIAVTTALLSLTATSAFAPSLSHVSSTRATVNEFQPMQMSSIDDDELSKLIGKRNAIKRKKREELPSEDDLLESLGDPSTLDLDKMPEFKVKRTARAPKKAEDDEKKQSAPAEVEFNDYYADYVSSVCAFCRFTHGCALKVSNLQQLLGGRK